MQPAFCAEAPSLLQTTLGIQKKRDTGIMSEGGSMAERMQSIRPRTPGFEGEAIYSVQGKPGRTFVMARPDSSEKHHREQARVIMWVGNVQVEMLSILNLYAQKEVDPQHETIVLFYMGHRSWPEWPGRTASGLLSMLRSRVSIAIAGHEEQEEGIRDSTARWLHAIDESELSTFTYAAHHCVRRLLRLHFVLWLRHDTAGFYQGSADEIEQLSWTRTNADCRRIKEALPELQRRLRSSV